MQNTKGVLQSFSTSSLPHNNSENFPVIRGFPILYSSKSKSLKKTVKEKYHRQPWLPSTFCGVQQTMSVSVTLKPSLTPWSSFSIWFRIIRILPLQSTTYLLFLLRIHNLDLKPLELEVQAPHMKQFKRHVMSLYNGIGFRSVNILTEIQPGI